MRQAERDTSAGKRKRWWPALGGTVLFTVVGLALAPGIARHERSTSLETAPKSSGAPVENDLADVIMRHLDPPEEAPQERAQVGGASFDCMILPSEVVEVGSAITGRIEEITVERSDYVEAGQVVARLESSVEQAAVNVASARAARRDELNSRQVSLDLGERRSARARELFGNNSLSLDVREEAETNARLAAVELERAEENRNISLLQLEEARAALSLRTIRTPISGFVVERLMAPGEVVDEETVMSIAQIDPLHVEVILPSHMFNRIQPGDRAEITPEALLDGVQTAEVVIVDKLIDGASGTFGARLLLPNPDHEMPAGLRCSVSFLPREDRVADRR